MKVNLHTSKVGTLVYFIHKELNLGRLFDRQTQNILSFFPEFVSILLLQLPVERTPLHTDVQHGMSEVWLGPF